MLALIAILVPIVIFGLLAILWLNVCVRHRPSPVIACVLYWTAGVVATILVLQLMQLATS